MNTDTTHTNHPRPLRRSSTDTKLGGVAGGLGDYFSVDPILFRIGFAVTTLVSGIGAVAYLALLVFVPKDGDESAPLGAQPVAA
jgi:phage shock protein PspC (stress-responsive transcriptional regulator)